MAPWDNILSAIHEAHLDGPISLDNYVLADPGNSTVLGTPWALLNQHRAEALCSTYQVTIGSYVEGGLSLHRQLDARRGRKGRTTGA